MGDRSAAHSAHWQDLELIFRRLLQHGDMRERRERVVYVSLRPTETFIHACLRPMEAARFRVRKCPNNLHLIIAQLTSILYKHAKRRVRYVYVYSQTLIGVFFVHGNGNMHACLT